MRKVNVPLVLFLTAAFLSFLFAVYLWFFLDRDLALFVGLWVPSILSLPRALDGRAAIHEAPPEPVAPSAEPGGDGLILLGVLGGLFAIYAAVFLNVSLQPATRLVAMVGMFVFMLVVVACLVIFLDWRRGHVVEDSRP